MPKSITPRTSLDNLKHEAKRWLRSLRAGDDHARARLESAWPDAPDAPTLRDVQHALALEYGQPGWEAVRERMAGLGTLARFEEVAGHFVRAFASDDLDALHALWEYFGHRRPPDVMRRYVRLGLGRPEYPPPGEVETISLEWHAGSGACHLRHVHWPHQRGDPHPRQVTQTEAAVSFESAGGHAGCGNSLQSRRRSELRGVRAVRLTRNEEVRLQEFRVQGSRFAKRRGQLRRRARGRRNLIEPDGRRWERPALPLSVTSSGSTTGSGAASARVTAQCSAAKTVMATGSVLRAVAIQRSW